MQDELVELVERARTGSDDAFNQLAATMIDRLYSVAFRMLRSTALAEDATQQALVLAWRRLPRLRDPARFEAWSHRILVNVCRDQMRRRPAAETSIDLLEPLTDGRTDAALNLSMRDELERAFAHLSPDHRAVVVLRHFLFWTTDEIAAALEVPPGTVGSRLHYAMESLRTALEAEERKASDVPIGVRS